MDKIYHFRVSSLISAKMFWIGMVLLTLAVGASKAGLQGSFQIAEEFGGLWIILIIVIAAFAESFIRLLGHRLEIKEGLFSLKTLFGTVWVIPIAGIQRIDPKIRNRENSGSFFSFTTDGKEYECPYVPKNYSELLNNLRTLNPTILLQENTTAPFNLLGADANLPINEYFTKKLGSQNLFTRFLIRLGAFSGVTLLIIFLVLTFILIVALAYFTK